MKVPFLSTWWMIQTTTDYGKTLLYQNHLASRDFLVSSRSKIHLLIFFLALRVWNWFLRCLDHITQEARIEEKKGKPKILLAVPAGCPKRAFTLILMAGGTRILYDLVPCISFRGWPQVKLRYDERDLFIQVAAPWLQETGKFWQRAGLRHSDAAGAFHLLPGRGRNSTDWRFCFARSEVPFHNRSHLQNFQVQLKKLVPQPFMKVFYCWRTVLARALSRQKTVLRPYALRAIFFWACDRVQVCNCCSQERRNWRYLEPISVSRGRNPIFFLWPDRRRAQMSPDSILSFVFSSTCQSSW